jgi:hypothetical protein
MEPMGGRPKRVTAAKMKQDSDFVWPQHKPKTSAISADEEMAAASGASLNNVLDRSSELSQKLNPPSLKEIQQQPTISAASPLAWKSTMVALEKRIQELECEQLMDHMKLRAVDNPAGHTTRTPRAPFTFRDITNATSTSPIPDSKQGKHSTDALKSGYDIKNQAPVVRSVGWPHGYLAQIQNIVSTKPDELTFEAFFFGYISILLQRLDPAEHHGRLQHAKQVLIHSMRHGWQSARAFHYQIVREIEVGNLSWSDQSMMQMIALSVASTSSRSTSQSGQAPTGQARQHLKFNKDDRNASDSSNSTDKRSIICYLYNNDESGCKFDKSENGCKKLHACSSCAAKGFFNKHHAAFDCKK